MITDYPKRSRYLLSAVLLLCFLCAGMAWCVEPQDKNLEPQSAETMRFGELMYRKGLLPSGKPMIATVQGGDELDGTMTTCANCHLQSGLGSIEGGVFSPPTTGVKLYAPRRGQMDIPGSTMKRAMFFGSGRSAYNDKSLSRALIEGVDPDGRVLSEVMPRYELEEKDLVVLINYLKKLSSEYSPGLTQETIRFATVITDEVKTEDREAFLTPLKAFINDDWNGRIKIVSDQWDAVWKRSPGTPKAFRKIELDVWTLKGLPQTWDKQLEAYYKQKPVFALIGGISTGSWEPIHNFCEKNKLPSLLPITDLPVISDNNRYTIYISKGVHQEGESAAQYLSRVFALAADKPIVQVFRSDERGQALASGFSVTWGKLGSNAVTNYSVPADVSINAEFWKKLSIENPQSVFLVWLAPSDLEAIGSLAGSGNKPLFFSSTLLGGNYAKLPDSIRDVSFLMHPNRLPEDEEYSRTILNNWMRFKKLPTGNLKITSQVFLLKSVFSEALNSIAGEFYREFFLDNLDEGRDQLQTSIAFPLLSFGPGQRYASKGCYVTTIAKGENPKLLKQSDWIIY